MIDARTTLAQTAADALAARITLIRRAERSIDLYAAGKDARFGALATHARAEVRVFNRCATRRSRRAGRRAR